MTALDRLWPAAVACLACHRPLNVAGFPNHEYVSYSAVELKEAAWQNSYHLNLIRAQIDSVVDPVRRAGLHSLHNALLPLSNDHSDYWFLSNDYWNFAFKQVHLPEHSLPLQLYPRLTHPHIAECVSVPTATGDERQPSRVEHWVFPYILDLNALALRDPTRLGAFIDRFSKGASWNSLGVNTSEEAERIRDTFSFWLEPQGQYADNNRCWIHLNEHIMSVDPFLVSTPSGDYDLTLPDTSAIGLMIDLPVDAGRPGLFGVRLLPRLGPPDTSGQPAWMELDGILTRWVAEGPPLHIRPCHRLVQFADRLHRIERESLWQFNYFRPLLLQIRTGIDEALRSLAQSDLTSARRHARRALKGVRRLIGPEHSYAPIFLDEPHDVGGAGTDFTFIVAGDLQYHDDLTAVLRFLACVDSSLRPEGYTFDIPVALQTRIDDAKFVLVAGDLADGAAGSAVFIATLNALGLFPPTSPYASLDEFTKLGPSFRRFSKPIFAVPGNHDGMVGYGGLLNNPLDGLSELLNEFRGIVPLEMLGRFLYGVNSCIPNGIKLHYPNTWLMPPRHIEYGETITPTQRDGMLSWCFAPRYDGLVEWRVLMGPLNVAFRYRDYTFIGLNSYNLTQPDRAGVGAMVFNWGGGVQGRDIAWLETMRDFLKQDGEGRGSFLFMHHDPRGLSTHSSTGSENAIVDGREERLSRFHATDSNLGYATFGWVGLSYSPATGLFIPLLTPAASYFIHHLASAGHFQQEWMRGYGADELLECINGAELQGLFFGHNNVALTGHWSVAETEEIIEGPRRSVGAWLGDNLWKRVAAQRLVDLRAQHDAPAVRLDDIGDQFSSADQGFHVITVRGSGSLEIDYVRL